jgi:hypothetical protein
MGCEPSMTPPSATRTPSHRGSRDGKESDFTKDRILQTV